MTLEEKDHFIEIDIKLADGTLIGTAEIEPNEKMLERFVIFEPYQNKGYDQRALSDLIDAYGIRKLWVRSDNEKAIHIYEKCGFKKSKETMFEMRKEVEECRALKNEQSDEDLISRQAVNKLRKYNLVGGIHTVSLDEINKLPSAKKTTINHEKTTKTGMDLISRKDLLNAIWQKEYGKDYDGVNMLNIPHIDIIEQMPSAEKTYEGLIEEIDKLPRIKVGNLNNPTVKYCIDEVLIYDLLEHYKTEKTTEWKYNYGFWFCTKCGYSLNDSHNVGNYCPNCPNCGAKMKGVEE